MDSIEGALSVRPRSAELLNVDVNVEEVTFKRGFYTVDVKYFYKIRGTLFPSGSDFVGMSVFDKRVILYGSEGNAKVFTSDSKPCIPGKCAKTNMPTAVVEAVDPIILGMKVVDTRISAIPVNDVYYIPDYITAAFGEELNLSSNGQRIFVTLGQFSIIRLERNAQLLIPSFDYCVPEKECAGACEEDACTLFGRIPFPIEEFFPPDSTGSGIEADC